MLRVLDQKQGQLEIFVCYMQEVISGQLSKENELL